MKGIRKKTPSYSSGGLIFILITAILAIAVIFAINFGKFPFDNRTRAAFENTSISAVQGDISVTVIPITFTSYPKNANFDSGSHSVAYIKEDILQLAPYLREASFGKASISSTSIIVKNRVTLNHKITLSDSSNPYSCVLDGNTWNNAWSQLAQEALTAAGVSPTSGQRIIFLAPGLSCGPYSRSDAWLQASSIYKGAWMQGYVTNPEYFDGSNPTRFSLTRKYLTPKGIIQAIGFTLGLSWISEDEGDPMGNTTLNKPLVLFNGAHASSLGWISSADIYSTSLGATNISKRMKIYGTNSIVNDPTSGAALPRLFKITSNGYTYYLDYRAPNAYRGSDGKKKFGFDDGGGYLASTNSIQGVEVLRFEGSVVKVLARLTASGQSFSESAGNIKITLQELVDDYGNYWENEDKMVRIDIEQIIKTSTSTPTPTTPASTAYKVRQSYLALAGDKYYQRTCPFDTNTGGPTTTCSASWVTISLGQPPASNPSQAGYIGAPANAGAMVNFLFPQNGVTKLRQSFLTTNGSQQYHRTCSFSPSQTDIGSYSSYKSNGCTTWSGPYAVTSVNGQTAYGGYAAITFSQ